MLRYTQTVRARVRGLGRRQTDAEQKLWQQLRGRQLGNAKFRRQYPIGQFIVDFCCPDHRLVVELDGGLHAEQIQKDRLRTQVLAQHGYCVLHFWDHEVLKDADAVLQRILMEIGYPHPGSRRGAQNHAHPFGGANVHRTFATTPSHLPERERENKNPAGVE